VAKSDEGITWIRSVTVTEIQVRGITSRLLNYRMYDEAEYRDHLMWLLEHGYKTRDHFVFRGYKTVIYSDGVHVLTLKEGKRLLPNKRMVSAYEIEVGQ
jgi:hypothetical protein